MSTGGGSKDKAPSHADPPSKNSAGSTPKETIRFQKRSQDKEKSDLADGYVLSAVNANIVTIIAVGQLKGMYHIDVHNTSIGRFCLVVSSVTIGWLGQLCSLPCPRIVLKLGWQ